MVEHTQTIRRQQPLGAYRDKISYCRCSTLQNYAQQDKIHNLYKNNLIFIFTITYCLIKQKQPSTGFVYNNSFETFRKIYSKTSVIETLC